MIHKATNPTRFLGLLLLGICWMTVYPALLSAETQEPLTLKDAIAHALEHNPQIRAIRHQREAADAKIIQARSGLLPQIFLSESFSRTNSPLWAFGTKLNQEEIQAPDFTPERLNNPDEINNYQTSLALSWNIYDGGRTWIGWRQAQQNRLAADQDLLRTEQNIIADAAKAYVGTMLAIEDRNVITHSLKTAQAHLRVVQNRYRNGLVVKSDLLRAQVRMADLEQQQLQAQSRVLVAQAMLKAVMGRSDNIGLKPIENFAECRPTEGDLQQWISQGMTHRSDLKRLKIKETIAEEGIARARSDHWPSLSLQGSYDLNTENWDRSAESYMLGATLRLNLYSGQRISAQAAEARAVRSTIRSQVESLTLAIRVETQKAFFQTQSAWESIAVAESAVAQAEEGLRIVANRYQSGLLTLVSLLDSQEAYQQASAQRFRAMHDYKIARIDLALAAGVINKDFE